MRADRAMVLAGCSMAAWFVAQLAGCVDNEYPVIESHLPDTAAILDDFIDRWEEVDGEPVGGDFYAGGMGVLRFEFVEGASGWHPACGDPVGLDGCTTWDNAAYAFHVQIQLNDSPEYMREIVRHELGHAAYRHHYGSIDADHETDWVWSDVVGWLDERD